MFFTVMHITGINASFNDLYLEVHTINKSESSQPHTDDNTDDNFIS